MKFLYGITWLLIFQLVGESLAIVLNLPVPGPVIGMMLLFAALLWRGRSSEALDEVSDGLLSHLSLLFVPAGVGIMVYFQPYCQRMAAHRFDAVAQHRDYDGDNRPDHVVGDAMVAKTIGEKGGR